MRVRYIGEKVPKRSENNEVMEHKTNQTREVKRG